MKSQFLGGAYQLRSLPLSAQTLVNLYAEINETKNGDIGAFYGTPGLDLKAQMSAGEGRGLHAGNDGYLYAVVDQNVYRISSTWDVVNLGTLSSTGGPVSITNNATQTLFSHFGGWHYTTGGTPIAAVSGAPIDSIVTLIDGYVIFTNGDDEFGITAINDVTSIDPLDVAEAEAFPDGLISVIADQREVWLLCNQSTEIWADTGAESFPFERIPGGVLSTGCCARFSPCFLDGSIFWLSQDRTGNATVVRTIGYQLERVSTHALEHAIEGYAVISDAFAYGYQSEGHSFYVLNFPTADVTWVYDTTTKLWHRRASQDSNGVLHKHRPQSYAFFNGLHCLLDATCGALYTYDLDTYTDNGTPIYRERAWPLAPEQEMRRLRADRLELMGEMGVGASSGTDTNPQVWLQMSYDGGSSFNNERYQTMGQMGSRYTRAVWKRCGMGRRPVARIATTSTRKVAWLGVNVDGEILSQ